VSANDAKAATVNNIISASTGALQAVPNPIVQVGAAVGGTALQAYITNATNIENNKDASYADKLCYTAEGSQGSQGEIVGGVWSSYYQGFTDVAGNRILGS
jgi:hypothetical protein